MQTIEYRDVIDKSSWGDGPWQTEPDKRQWPDATTGLPCLAVRNSEAGNWCGYVGVPPSHPLFGKEYQEMDGMIEVHGGLTFSGGCREWKPEASAICHITDPGDPEVHWFGFDCNHYLDIAPGHEAMMAKYRLHLPRINDPEQQYRDLPYVEAECRLHGALT